LIQKKQDRSPQFPESKTVFPAPCPGSWQDAWLVYLTWTLPLSGRTGSNPSRGITGDSAIVSL